MTKGIDMTTGIRTHNPEGESRAASARTLHPLVGHSDSEGGRE